MPAVRFLDTLLKLKASLLAYFNPIYKYAPGPGTLFSLLSLFDFAMIPKAGFILTPVFDLKLKDTNIKVTDKNVARTVVDNYERFLA